MAVQELANVTAAILAGGLGTRLRSVVADRPKVLAEIQGRPFLAYLLDQLAVAGVRDVVLCTGYMGEQVQAMFGDSYGCLRLVYSQESSPLGTAGALRLALPLFKSTSVLVMNGDSFCETDLKAFWTWHCARDAEATLLLTQMPDTRRYGRVHLDADGLVSRFDEKNDKRGCGWINAGIYLIHHRLLLTIPKSGAVSLEREVFPAWIERGLYGYPSEGRFLDIGTPEAYAIAERFFALNMLT
ncbi:nucleotidyltransferase family protein [Candidatus Poribacteria bacterium]|nr:nucleotidyltransferase family protein [Candidatus Poribacteria bacterium]